MKRYVGNLLVTGRSDLNLGSYVIMSDNRSEGVNRIVADAERDMENGAIATATLVIQEDDVRVAERHLQNQKYALLN